MQNTKPKHMASVSGGKCSIAMVLKMLENNMEIDELVYFDSGWEFPIMIKQAKKLAKKTGLKLTFLKPDPSFEDILFRLPIKRKIGPDKGKIYRHGHGWPVHNRRWNDREMVNVINRYCGHSIQYIGYPFEREHKQKGQKNRSGATIFDGSFDKKKSYEEVQDLTQKKNTRYPLIEFGMDGNDCLRYCKQHGFDWADFYEGRDRAGMYCCPLQPMSAIRLLRKQYPGLWEYMIWCDQQIEPNFGFNHGKTIVELEKQFQKEEEKQKRLEENSLL